MNIETILNIISNFSNWMWNQLSNVKLYFLLLVTNINDVRLTNWWLFQVLHLSNMPLLHTIAPQTLMSTPSLTSLSLSSNRKLAPLPPALFSPTPHLATLDISNCQWSSLAPHQLPVNPEKIILSGDPSNIFHVTACWKSCNIDHVFVFSSLHLENIFLTNC